MNPALSAPPAFICAPDAKHSLESRLFQGIPSLATSPSGRLWATWYAGCTPGEDKNNYVVLSTSRDGGETWQEKLVVDPDGPGPARSFDPEIWVDPKGRLWWFWAQSIGHNGDISGVWAMTAEGADSDEPRWSKPRRLTGGVMMCKPLVLSTGEWMLPVSTWRNTDDSAKTVVSEDRGELWHIRGGCHVPPADRIYDEHIIVEKNDKSLWMLVRTNYGIGESVSSDGGRTWSALTPSSIQHPSSRFFIRRLASGSLLLVKHGPIHERTNRSRLTAYISRDDGRSWLGELMLDERSGLSYPDGQQTADGTICIIYDYSRIGERAILMAKFKEEDVLAASADSSSVVLRMTVSKPR